MNAVAPRLVESPALQSQSLTPNHPCRDLAQVTRHQPARDKVAVLEIGLYANHLDRILEGQQLEAEALAEIEAQKNKPSPKPL
jgi:hypothetical protein